MTEIIKFNNIAVGGGQPLLLIAGPCVIETEDITFEIAAYLKDLTRRLQIPFVSS